MNSINKAIQSLVSYSGGSSVEGHFSAPFGAISVDFLNMGKVVAFHPEGFVYFPHSNWKLKSGRSADLFRMTSLCNPQSLGWT